MSDSASELRSWRRQQSPPVTLAALAARLKTTKATLSRLETGDLPMTVTWARRINAETGIPMRLLMPDLAAEFADVDGEPAGAAP